MSDSNIHWYFSFGITVIVQIISIVGLYWKLRMDIQSLKDSKIDKKEHDSICLASTTNQINLERRIRDLETSKVDIKTFNEIKEQLIILESEVNNRFTGIESMNKTLLTKFDTLIDYLKNAK